MKESVHSSRIPGVKPCPDSNPCLAFQCHPLQAGTQPWMAKSESLKLEIAAKYFFFQENISVLTLFSHCSQSKLSVPEWKLSSFRFLVSSWEVLWNGKGTPKAPSMSPRGSGITSPLGEQVERLQGANPAWGAL